MYHGIVLPLDFAQLWHVTEILVQFLLESCVGYSAQGVNLVVSVLGFRLELRRGFQLIDVNEEEVVDVPRQIDGCYNQYWIQTTRPAEDSHVSIEMSNYCILISQSQLSISKVLRLRLPISCRLAMLDTSSRTQLSKYLPILGGTCPVSQTCMQTLVSSCHLKSRGKDN